MDITNMDRTTMDDTNNTDNTTNTKITNAKHCSLCGGIGHNKRSCPTKEIDDTSVRTQANAVDNAVDSDSDFEEITISEKKKNPQTIEYILIKTRQEEVALNNIQMQIL